MSGKSLSTLFHFLIFFFITFYNSLSLPPSPPPPLPLPPIQCCWGLVLVLKNGHHRSSLFRGRGELCYVESIFIDHL